MIGAAEVASPGVRPLPLFYALSQAGRTIAAADLPDVWKLHWHGITCPDLSPVSVLDLEITPHPSSKPDEPDSFHGVATAAGSEAPTESIQLGALWMALPQVSRLIADVDGIDRWPEALLAVPPELTTSKLERFDVVKAALISFQHPDGVSLVPELSKYPHSERGETGCRGTTKHAGPPRPLRPGRRPLVASSCRG